MRGHKSTSAHSKTVTRHDSGYHRIAKVAKHSVKSHHRPDMTASSSRGRHGQVNTTKNYA